MIVIDASIAIALALGESNVADSTSVYAAFTVDRLTAPAHWPAEIANAIWINRRRNRIPPARFRTIIEDLFTFRPTIDSAPTRDRIPLLVEFAEAEKLTVYDAIYVQLAITKGASLATIDTDMRNCAKRLDIPLLPM